MARTVSDAEARASRQSEVNHRQLDEFIDGALLADLRQRLRATLDFDLANAERIALGFNNNRLFGLYSCDGRRAVAKVYYRDERRRLEREYELLRLLQRRAIARVPVPLLRCDQHYYAVYSHEPGLTKHAAEITKTEAEEIGRFAADLHGIGPGDPDAPFQPVANGCFSVAAKMAAIRERLPTFDQFAVDSAAPAAVRHLCAEIDVVRVLEQLLVDAIADLSATEITAVIPPEDRRLDSGDFAPHTVLVRPDGGVCVLDFENAGWDQPLGMTACFLTAATCLDLGDEEAAAFLRTYREALPEADGQVVHFERFCALQHLFWCAIHLSLTTPPHLARKRFANPNLDVEAVIADQVAQFRRRLTVTKAAVASIAAYG